MRDSRLKSKQVDTSHTGETVQPRAPLVYILSLLSLHRICTEAAIGKYKPNLVLKFFVFLKLTKYL